MTEFTDGTAKGKTLSLIELSNQLEELNNQLTELPLILHGKIENFVVGKNNGKTFDITFGPAFKSTPTLVASLEGGYAYWSNLALSVDNITVNGANLRIWNNTGEADITTAIEWIAIGERG